MKQPYACRRCALVFTSRRRIRVYCSNACRLEALHYNNRRDPKARIQEQAVKDANGCWLWPSSPQTNGYGVINVDRKVQKAHRVAYRLFVGPIPDGLDLDHLCRRRNCVNPLHLEVVTRSENIRRGYASRRMESALHGSSSVGN